jgi:hypothetical protein
MYVMYASNVASSYPSTSVEEADLAIWLICSLNSLTYDPYGSIGCAAEGCADEGFLIAGWEASCQARPVIRPRCSGCSLHAPMKRSKEFLHCHGRRGAGLITTGIKL